MKKLENHKQKLTAIDLFSGAGGLTCGLKQAGFQVLSGVEVTPLAAATYRANHKEVNLIENDIRTLSPEIVMNDLGLKRGELSLLAGCPPCQGFSTLRTRHKASSVDDERNDLVHEFMRWVKAFFPSVVMLENVPPLAKDRRMNVILAELKKLGYYLESRSLRIDNIADYGVPQRRRRMILIVSRLREMGLKENKPIHKTVRQAFEGMKKSGESGDPLHDITANHSEKIKKMITLIPKDGGSRTDLPEEYWLPCHKRYPNGFRDVYGRMSWDNVSPTITGGCINPSKGRFLHPEENRAITLREAAALQTFPSDYFFPTNVAKDKVALMIGNALPPEFIRRQGELIKQHLLKSDR